MQPQINKSGIMITLTTIGGGDCSGGLLRLLQALPKEARKCVIELPDLGIARLYDHLGLHRVINWEPARSINQWLLDFHLKEHRDIQQYLIEHEAVHYLCLHPSSSSSQPVTQCLDSNQALIDMPLYLKLQLCGLYDYILFVTQGTMIHPMTHFAIRYADAAVLYSDTQLDIDHHLGLLQELTTTYQMEPERLFHFIRRKRNLRLPVLSEQRTEELLRKIHRLSRIPVFWRDPMLEWVEPAHLAGQIRAKDYKEYEPAPLELTRVDRTDLSGAKQLSFDWVVGSAGAAKIKKVDDMYEQIKRFVCEHGLHSSEYLRIKFRIRRKRVIDILQELAEEGVLHRPAEQGKSYTIKWTKEEIETYLLQSSRKAADFLSTSSSSSTVPATVPGTVPVI